MSGFLNRLLRIAAMLLFPVLPAAGEVLLEDHFANGIPEHWVPWTAGTGQVSVTDGAARFTVTDQSCACRYSDAEISDVVGYDPLPWLYVNVDFRLRASNSNRYLGETGAGSRGWGFWTGHFGALGGEARAANWLWFISLSPESDPPFPGYWANAVTNDVIGIIAEVGADMTAWHDYRIVWRRDVAEFYVDGRFVAMQSPTPSVPMGLVFWIDNYQVFWNGSFWERGFLELAEDQFIELERVAVYTSRARFTDAAGEKRESYILGAEPIHVTLDDPDENLSRVVADEVFAVVRDPANGDEETLRLVETSPVSGRFTGAPLPSREAAAEVGNGVLETAPGHTVVLSYADADDPADTDRDDATVEAGPDCPGDCDANGAVSIDELVRAVAVALRQRRIDDCPAIDRDGNEAASVDELVAAVGAALTGCSETS